MLPSSDCCSPCFWSCGKAKNPRSICRHPHALMPQNPNIFDISSFCGLLPLWQGVGNFDKHHSGHDRVCSTNTACFLGPALVSSTPGAPSFYFQTCHAICVFLLFEQSKGFNDQTLINPTSSRLYFNISSFAQAVGLGDPIGGTFMYVGQMFQQWLKLWYHGPKYLHMGWEGIQICYY